MDFDKVQPIRFIVVILKYLGLWRLNGNYKTIYAAYGYVLHFLFTFLTIATMWISVFTAKELEQIIESLYMSLIEAALLAKVFNIFYLNEEAVLFFELFEGESFDLRNSEEVEIFKSAHRLIYNVGRFYLITSLAGITFGFTAVAIGPYWVLPYPAWMPFDLHSEYFWYAFGFQLLGIIVTCLANVCLDMLQCYFLHHLSLIYKIIGYRCANIGFDVEPNAASKKVNQRVLKDLTEIVRTHEHVKRVTVECERFISFPFFMQILLSALVLCCTGYQIQITSPRENPGKFFLVVDILVVMGLQIFLQCYYGNQVTVESGKLNEALYNSNWIDLPTKSWRMIYLYMGFLQNPVVIKAGGFFRIGLPIFSKTLNNAYSYFALLIRMKK